MNHSPFALTAAACAAALAVSQVFISTVKAQPTVQPDYRVQVEWQKVDRSVSGLIIQGRVKNTGNAPMIYTQVMPVLSNSSGKAIFTGQGYLTISPLLPGQSAEFRACETKAPPFTSLHIQFREAGHPVVVEGEPQGRALAASPATQPVLQAACKL